MLHDLANSVPKQGGGEGWVTLAGVGGRSGKALQREKSFPAEGAGRADTLQADGELGSRERAQRPGHTRHSGRAQLRAWQEQGT